MSTLTYIIIQIKAIIKKRLRHEYKLVRIQRQKQDFLAYIQYEINLLDLIQQRRKAIQYYFKKDEIEFAIITRIHRFDNLGVYSCICKLFLIFKFTSFICFIF